MKRPAGFRTHILVCIGSTLITLTGIFLFNQYNSITTIDPSRLSAQIISGIGFLGAGTIIKEGSSVKGLTTAAGLWAVAGIGIAIGSGFYVGSLVSTIFILVTLIIFSKLDKFIKHNKNEINIKVNTIDRPGLIGEIGTVLGSLNVSIESISLEELDDKNIIIEIRAIVPKKLVKMDIINSLYNLENITSAKAYDL